MLLVLHRYRALAVRESITALRASLPPAADAPPETLPEREALVTALHDFDIGSSVGLSAPFLLQGHGGLSAIRSSHSRRTVSSEPKSPYT
jgi:hypothetical protein